MNYAEPDAADYTGEDPVMEKQATLTPPVNWWLLSEDEKSLHLARVTNFTLRLVLSYGLGVEIIPPCWHQHEEMVQELLALTQYRNDQQFIPDQAPGAAIDFHEKFALWRQRMRQWVSEAGCKGNEHVVKPKPQWAVEDTAAFDKAEKSRIEFIAALTKPKETSK